MKDFGIFRIFIILALISVVLTFIFVYFKPVEKQQKIEDNSKKVKLLELQENIENYYKKTGKYPKSSTEEPMYRIIRLDGTIADWGRQWSPFMDILPEDSKGRNFVYFSDNDGQKYYLYASLERGGEDPDACNPDGSPCRSLAINGIEENACGGICNFGLSSKNVRP